MNGCGAHVRGRIYYENRLCHAMDEEEAEEFLVTGHVAGNETLYKEIKQVKAGEMAKVGTRVNKSGGINALRYFSYRRGMEIH